MTGPATMGRGSYGVKLGVPFGLEPGAAARLCTGARPGCPPHGRASVSRRFQRARPGRSWPAMAWRDKHPSREGRGGHERPGSCPDEIDAKWNARPSGGHLWGVPQSAEPRKLPGSRPRRNTAPVVVGASTGLRTGCRPRSNGSDAVPSPRVGVRRRTDERRGDGRFDSAAGADEVGERRRPLDVGRQLVVSGRFSL